MPAGAPAMGFGWLQPPPLPMISPVPPSTLVPALPPMRRSILPMPKLSTSARSFKSLTGLSVQTRPVMLQSTPWGDSSQPAGARWIGGAAPGWAAAPGPENCPRLVSRHRSSVGLRWPSKRIAALHRLPIRSGFAARCGLRYAPMAARSLRHLIRDATLVAVDRASIAHIPGIRAVVVIRDFVGPVAEREEQAEQALRELRVRWKDWPGFPRQDSPEALARAIRANPATQRRLVDEGDVDGALARADPAMPRTYIWPYQMHASIGPSCALAAWSADSQAGAAPRLTVWAGTQNPHLLRADLVSRHRSSVGLRWPSKRIAALHRLPIQLGMGCAMRLTLRSDGCAQPTTSDP